MNNLPFVSVIIPAYNEEKNISLCINSIKRNNYPDKRYEIIVVDNGSQDKTVSISKTLTQHVYSCPNKNISSLRNFGAKQARGEIYAFIDADCIADQKWILSAVNLLQNENCVAGSEVLIPENATWIEKTWFNQKKGGKYETTHVGSANLVVRGDIFRKLGGFNENIITGEDYEFCLRARKLVKVISDDKIKVVHLGNPKTIRDFLKREIWHGLGSFSSFKLNWMDKPLLGSLLFSLLSAAQLIGLGYIFTHRNFALFYASTLSLFFLLVSTVLYRRKNIVSFHSLKLTLLYYFYYLGRSISLLYILRRSDSCRFRAPEKEARD